MVILQQATVCTRGGWLAGGAKIAVLVTRRLGLRSVTVAEKCPLFVLFAESCAPRIFAPGFNGRFKVTSTAAQGFLGQRGYNDVHAKTKGGIAVISLVQKVTRYALQCHIARLVVDRTKAREFCELRRETANFRSALSPTIKDEHPSRMCTE